MQCGPSPVHLDRLVTAVKVKYDLSDLSPTKMKGNAADTCALESLPVSTELHATGQPKNGIGGATCGHSTASSNLWTQECQRPLGCSLQADRLHGAYSDALLLKTSAQRWVMSPTFPCSFKPPSSLLGSNEKLWCCVLSLPWVGKTLRTLEALAKLSPKRGPNTHKNWRSIDPDMLTDTVERALYSWYWECDLPKGHSLPVRSWWEFARIRSNLPQQLFWQCVLGYPW